MHQVISRNRTKSDTASWRAQVEAALGPLKPIETDNPRLVGQILHQVFRAYILQGILQPGTVLDQVSIAEHMCISRTPVREVLRMLKEEGLVTADVNLRARVSSISYDELEALYATRISTETLALATAIAKNQPDDFVKIREALDALEFEPFDIQTWTKRHQQFHLAIYHRAGEGMVRLIQSNIEKSERFLFYARRGATPRDHSRNGGKEHEQIVQSCLEGDANRAVGLLAHHLTKTAVEVLNDLSPEREPVLIRRALRFANAAAAAGAVGSGI